MVNAKIFHLLVVVLLSLGEVLGPLLHRLLGGQEVGDELFARLVHDTPDHGLRHHLDLCRR